MAIKRTEEGSTISSTLSLHKLLVHECFDFYKSKHSISTMRDYFPFLLEESDGAVGSSTTNL